MDRAKHHLKRHIPPVMVRYALMAATIVGLELLLFIEMIRAGMWYVLATVISLVLGLFLNWYYSHRFVFTNRPHPPHKELGLSVVAGSVGMIIQVGVVILLVQLINAAPLLGKAVAMCATFAWNYWFRKKYVFEE